MHTIRKLLLIAIGATFVTACQEDLTDLGEPDSIDDIALPTHTADDESEDVVREGFAPRIAFDVQVAGDLAPYATVTVEIEGQATEKLTGGDIRVLLPTIAAMKHAGAGERPSYPVGKSFPVEAKWALPAMDEGDTWKRSFELKLPDKGYYHVAVEADTRGPDDKAHLHAIDDTYDQLWLYVTDSGGFVTPIFDESVFDDHVIPQPGPFETSRAHSQGDQVASDGAGVSFDDDDDPITLKLVYFENGVYKIGVGAVVIATYVSQSDQRGYDVEKTVPASGIVEFDCPGEYEYISGTSMVPDTEEVYARYHLASWEADQHDCGDSFQLLGNDVAFVPWRNLNELIPRIEDYFNKYRARVNYRVKSGPLVYTSYDKSADMITLKTGDHDDFWVTAHEFGHALHHHALGGIWYLGLLSCRGHQIHKPSSYRCALAEGFADYAASVGEEDEAYWERVHYESDDGEPGEIEGNIAALLHDLIDGGSETNDETNYSADYVTDVFTTCRVSGNSMRNDVSDLVWCLENRVNSTVHKANFPGIAAPSDATEYATEPDDWDADDIRSTWLKNVGK